MSGPYTFQQIFAADPSNTANVAKNASILLFDPADPTMKPLTITDVNTGLALANPVPTNANGWGPIFNHATLDQVAWSGGGFKGTFESYRGMKDVAVAAASSASASAGSAALAATNAASAVDAVLADVVQDSEAAKVAAQQAAALVGAPADTVTAALVGNPATLTGAALKATFVPKWQANTSYVLGQQVIAPNGSAVTALASFTSGSTYSDANWRMGTPSTGVPVAKPSADIRPAVWEYTHAAAVGYLYHLLATGSFNDGSALIALGLDNTLGGTGILIANKSKSSGMVINQQATISDPEAYGIKITGSTTQAASLRIEQNVDGAADGLQVLALNATPPVGQRLAYFGKQGGEAGSIFALDGRLEWKSPIRVRAQNASIDNFLEVTENTAYAYGDPNAYLGQVSKKGLNLYSPNGGGALWRFGIETGGSYMNIRTGAAGAVGAAATYDVIKIQHQKLAFFGTTPVTKPAAISSPAADVAALKTAVDSIRTTLTALGLTS